MIHGSKLSVSNLVSQKPNPRQGEYSKVNGNQPDPRGRQGIYTRDLLQEQLENVELWTAIGRIYEKQREFAKATAAYRQGSEIDPTGSDVAAAWARSALAAGDYKEAKDAVRKLRSIDPLRVGPALADHPIMIEGRKAEDAAKAQEKPIVKVQIGPRTSGIIPQRENVNTVPVQDPKENAAPRQM